MKRTIELKHVAPKDHVRRLIDELIDRLEAKMQYIESDAASIHVLFDENGTHALYHTALTCHIPGHLLATHKEGRDPGAIIRDAFKDLTTQLGKCATILRHEASRKRARNIRSRPPSF